jgi:hypothetical protein
MTRHFQNPENQVVYTVPFHAESVQRHTEVQVAPLDAIVIERADLPAIERKSDGRYRFDTGIDWTLDPDDDTAERAYVGALEHLALCEYLREHPPVDEAQVDEAKRDLFLWIADEKRRSAVAQGLVKAGWRKSE